MKFYRTFWSLDTQILSSLYIAIHKFGVAMIFKMFLSLMLTKSAFIDQKCSNKKTLFWNITISITVFYLNIF